MISILGISIATVATVVGSYVGSTAGEATYGLISEFYRYYYTDKKNGYLKDNPEDIGKDLSLIEMMRKTREKNQTIHKLNREENC